MVRQNLRLVVDTLREPVLENLGDASVQFLASGAQQCAIGRVLHQRMLEEVGGLGRQAAAEQQPGLGEPVEP